MPWAVGQLAFTHVTVTLGVLFTAALLAGAAGRVLRLPRVTSYLLVGIMLGPSVLDLIPPDHITQFEPLTRLAIALVLFTLGCHFPLARARRIARRVLRLSAGELCTTFLLVAAGLPLLGASWSVALMLGALALATAPATTILVLKETQSEGTVTEYANALVAINNLVSIVVFELLFLAILFAGGRLDSSLGTQIARLANDLAGSVAVGVAAGLAVSFGCGIVGEGRRLVLLVGLITLVLGVCLAAEMPYLLAFLAMGVTVANSSDQTRQVLSELDRLTGLLCVMFFVTHGAELELDKLHAAGWIGAGYIILRTGGKYLGIRLSGQSDHEERVARKWLGSALLAQAGAAIALSSIAVHRTADVAGNLHALCEQVQTVILGTVVVFEIAGPLLIRHAVLRAGEVPLAHAIYHPGTGLFDQLRIVSNRLMLALGLDPWAKRSWEDITINEIMRRNVPAVPQKATFDEVIAIMEHRRENTFPVVAEDGELVGVIRYRELSHALFDRELGGLVRAADLTTPLRNVLYPDLQVASAIAMFTGARDDCVPVVARETPHQLLAAVYRRDVLRLLIRWRKSVEGADFSQQ